MKPTHPPQHLVRSLENLPQHRLIRLITREAVQTVACPRCGACPGRCCIGYSGQQRTANHIERVQLALSSMIPSAADNVSFWYS